MRKLFLVQTWPHQLLRYSKVCRGLKHHTLPIPIVQHPPPPSTTTITTTTHHPPQLPLSPSNTTITHYHSLYTTRDQFSILHTLKKQTVFFLQTDICFTSSSTDVCRCDLQTANILPLKKRPSVSFPRKSAEEEHINHKFIT